MYPGAITFPGSAVYPGTAAPPPPAPALDPSRLSAVIGGVTAPGRLAAISGVAGDDLTFPVVISYDGAALDLSGYTVTAVLKPRPTSPDADGTSYTLAVADAAAGTCTWTIPHADTAVPGDRAYHVKLTDSSGRVATAVYGILTLAAA